MKKTLLASAILASLVSVSAQAATIYEQEGTTIEVSGSAEVASYFNVAGTAVSDSSGGLGIEGSSKISDSVTAYAEFAIESDASGDEVTTDDLLIGFDTAFGDFSVGATDTALEKIADFTDVGDEFGGIQEIVSGGGDTGFFYTNSFGGVSVNAEFIASEDKDADSMGASVTYFSEFGLGLGLGYTVVETGADDDSNEIAVGVSYAVGDFYVGLGYAIASDIGTEFNDNDYTVNLDATSIELAVKYQVTSALGLAFIAGQTEVEAAEGGGSSVTVIDTYAIEAGYAVNDSVYTYVAFQTNNLGDSDDTENGFTVSGDDVIKASIEYSF